MRWSDVLGFMHDRILRLGELSIFSFTLSDGGCDLVLFHDLGTLIVGHGFGDALFKVVKFSFRGDDGWLDGAYFRLNVRLGLWLKVGRDILMNGVGFDRSFGGSGLGCRGHSYRLGGGCRSWFSCVPRLIFGLAGGSDFAR